MSSLANWYSSHWRRRVAEPQDQEAMPVPPPAAAPAPTTPPATTGEQKTTANGTETLFGPSLGAVAQAPEWTNLAPKGSKVVDELTPDIVRAWVQRSKDKTVPTTTLQALVNLKRPTLKLSPLAAAADADSHAHAHAIEFEFDADVPKCGISVHVLPDTGSPVQVYEHVLVGGFGRQLKLEDDAVIELDKYEIRHGATATAVPTSTSDAALAAAPIAQPAAAAASKRRFSNFPFRRQHQRAIAQGPALQVVDVDAQNQHTAAEGEAKPDEAGTDGGGVRLIIKLEALDDNERSLASVNTQTTYLHVVRLGSRPDGAGENDDDTRPWVVKVVKREATIGFHTFHLHEIYGLTSSSTSTSTAEAVPATYPPSSTTTPAADNTYDFAGQECVLCLSSPREVVLLPCRHLVACRDCALNMIEFGAGGQLNQTTEPVATAGADAAATPGDGADGAAPAAPAPAPVPAPRPRKRKPKGWFCPVCRQPYTSLLRISTQAPDAKQVRDSEDGEEPQAQGTDLGTVPLSAPGVVHVIGGDSRSPSPAPPASPSAPAQEEKKTNESGPAKRNNENEAGTTAHHAGDLAQVV